MRMLIPPVKLRRRIHFWLTRFFDDYQFDDFNAALNTLVEYYKTKKPQIEWYEYINHGKWLGETRQDGKINLIHPENWKQIKPTEVFKPTCSLWIATVLHEFHHYLHWVEDEAKADLFARKFVTGVK